jgi:UDP-glucose 4-epimerase
VVAIFLDAIAAGEETTIYGDGRQTRDFVHVDDVVRALLLAPAKAGVFNVGSGVETSVRELHERCRAVGGDGREPTFAPARAGDVLRSVLDVSLAERELGWRPEVSLDEGLRRTWEWLQSRT